MVVSVDERADDSVWRADTRWSDIYKRVLSIDELAARFIYQYVFDVRTYA